MALFRYPGGKVKLTKHILPALYRYKGFQTFVEPFTGGGSVALAMAAQYPGVRLILNDLDTDMSSFWQVVACDSDPEFESLVVRMATRPTLERFKELQSNQPTDRLDRAYRAMFFCRASHITAIGKRPLGGWAQKSKGKIDSRWNSERIIREMRDARKLLHGRTTVLNADFAQVIPLAEANSLMYLDPPYYKAGNQLYNFPWTDEDHVRLRDALRGKSNWVLSYDDHSRIRELYSVLARPVAVTYSIGKTKKTELLLFRRLEFKPDFNPEVGVTDTLRIWADPRCPRCKTEMDVRPCLVCGYPNEKN